MSKMNDECKYLAVEVSKQMFTTVYFKVPKDFDDWDYIPNDY